MVLRLIQLCRIQWCRSFFSFGPKHPFWTNFLQKIKAVSLSWNLVPRLIQICRIQSEWSLFLFYTRNIFFCLLFLRLHWSTGDFEIGSSLQHTFFILLRWVGLRNVYGDYLRNFKDLKHKQSYFTQIIFLLKKLSFQFLIELFI